MSERIFPAGSRNARHSPNNQTAGWKIGLAMLLSFILIFLIGRAWIWLRAARTAPVAEYYVDRQLVAARGNIGEIWTSAQGLYYTVPEAGTFLVMRRFFSEDAALGLWLTRSPYYVQTVAADATQALTVEADARLYRLPLDSYAPALWWEADSLGSDCKILSAALMAEGGALLGLERQGKAGIYSLSEEGEVTFLTEGNSPVLHPVKPQFYFVREEMIWVWDFKQQTAAKIVAGRQVDVSEDGRYLCVISPDAKRIQMIRESFPEQVKVISYADGATPDYTYRSAKWDQKNTIYAVRTAAGEKDEIVRYHIRTSAMLPEDQGSVWAEGKMAGDAEAVQRAFPNQPAGNPGESSRGLVLGYELADYGMSKTGQYLTVDWQMAGLAGEYGYVRDNLYLESAGGGYLIQKYLSTSENWYVAEAGKLYLKHRSADLGAIPEGVSAYAYNESFKEYLYITEEEGVSTLFLAYANKPEREPLRFGVPLPPGAKVQQLSLNQAGDIVAVQFSQAAKKSLLLFNLQQSRWVDTPFLNHIERAYWRKNDLIIHRKNQETIFRWRYHPGYGILGLDDGNSF